VSLPVDRTTYRSPNHSSRGGRDVSILVMHATAGTALGALSWLCNPDSRVSAHYLITRGGAIYQLVDEGRAAWHAGPSWHRGLGFINERSIGIELEHSNRPNDPYPPAQRGAAVALAQDIVSRHAITRENVVRHSDIALPRGRKSDPAGFPWEAFLLDVYSAQVARRYMVNVLAARYRTAPSTADETRAGVLARGNILVGEIITNGEVVNGDPRWLRFKRQDRVYYMWAGLVEAL
jgi:N-acetyl-anhydromuramyl-L-alanine amidase AmpD